MPTDGSATRADARSATAKDDAQELVGYCARPLCRGEFRRILGPGRPAAFCSDICRRRAEKEHRQATARLTNYEAVVEQLRIDVAAFGHSVEADAGDQGAVTPDMRRRAQDAVQRAGGAVEFLRESTEPGGRELCALYDAVAPVLRS